MEGARPKSEERGGKELNINVQRRVENGKTVLAISETIQERENSVAKARLIIALDFTDFSSLHFLPYRCHELSDLAAFRVA